MIPASQVRLTSTYILSLLSVALGIRCFHERSNAGPLTLARTTMQCHTEYCAKHTGNVTWDSYSRGKGWGNGNVKFCGGPRTCQADGCTVGSVKITVQISVPSGTLFVSGTHCCCKTDLCNGDPKTTTTESLPTTKKQLVKPTKKARKGRHGATSTAETGRVVLSSTSAAVTKPRPHIAPITMPSREKNEVDPPVVLKKGAVVESAPPKVENPLLRGPKTAEMAARNKGNQSVSPAVAATRKMAPTNGSQPEFLKERKLLLMLKIIGILVAHINYGM